MSLYDILACPNCKVHLRRADDWLHCAACANRYPIIQGVPVIFPDASVPEIEHEAEVVTRDTYNPWVHRTILQSLFDHQLVLEIGAGNMALDDPCIIRTDVKHSPHLDVVADAHALPFLPGSFDYIFSLATFEHLRNPFTAAASIHDSLKDGGYVYHECNFVFAYHGYPHHYFNASLQGMEEIFAAFRPLRKGVATYQMPSFALDMVLRSYLHASHAAEHAHGRRIVDKINAILSEDLIQYDIYFSEAEALNVAAGTYFAGMKSAAPDATLLPPPIMDIWQRDPALRQRYPDPNRATDPDNLFWWAKTEGRTTYPEIAAALDALPRYHKRGPDAPWNRSYIHSLPMEATKFGAIGYDSDFPMAANAALATTRRAQSGSTPAGDLLSRTRAQLSALASRALRRLRP